MNCQKSLKFFERKSLKKQMSERMKGNKFSVGFQNALGHGAPLGNKNAIGNKGGKKITLCSDAAHRLTADDCFPN